MAAEQALAVDTRWAQGYGPIRHSSATQKLVHELAERLVAAELLPDAGQVYSVLAAADRIACAAMWLVVHATYARRVYLDGRALSQDDFKRDPQGHTGGSLNMVPAYVGYLGPPGGDRGPRRPPLPGGAHRRLRRGLAP